MCQLEPLALILEVPAVLHLDPYIQNGVTRGYPDDISRLLLGKHVLRDHWNYLVIYGGKTKKYNMSKPAN